MQKRAAILALCLAAPQALFCSCNSSKPVPARESGSARSSTSVGQGAPLALEDVFRWRQKYSDLLGKTKDAVVERYGEPIKGENTGIATFNASDRTGNRKVVISFEGETVRHVKVFAGPNDHLDVTEVIKRAQTFTFDSGTYEDSSMNYFAATTRDKRNVVQFTVSEQGVVFEAVIFRTDTK